MRYPGSIGAPLLTLLCLRFLHLSALASSPAQEMADAAQNFLAALTPDQKAKALFEFGHDERYDWHFIPKPRKGLPIKEMTSPQRLLAHALLGSGLSQRGYYRAHQRVPVVIGGQFPDHDAAELVG